MFCGRFSATTVKFLKVWPRSFWHKLPLFRCCVNVYRIKEADGILDSAGHRRAIWLPGEREKLLKSETSVVHNKLLTIRSVIYPVNVRRLGLKVQLNPSRVKNVIEVLWTIDFSKLFELLTSTRNKQSDVLTVACKSPTKNCLKIRNYRRTFIATKILKRSYRFDDFTRCR